MIKLRKLVLAVLLTCGLALSNLAPVFAADPPTDFSLQVTPSPLVVTLKPGQTTQLELKIRNAGTGTENLKIEPRSFQFSSSTGQVELNDTTPPDISNWISFNKPLFTVQPGEVFTQGVKFALPKDTGFSYSFALVISRQTQTKVTSGRALEGSLAVFTLVNVDRPGATRKLDVATFSISKHVYEYLPAKLNVTLKNSGNTIVQPFGNIFVQRGSTAKTPLASLTFNSQKSYILPGTSRSLDSSWVSGFPYYKSVSADDGKTKQKLVWNWSKVSDFRIGRYTAKLVAVYDDGNGHDIPIEGEVSFWVFPWKILLGLLVVALLVLFGLYSLVKKIISIIRKISGKTKKSTPQPPAPKE